MKLPTDLIPDPSIYSDARCGTHLLLRAVEAPHPNPKMKFIHGVSGSAAGALKVFCGAPVESKAGFTQRWFLPDLLDPSVSLGCAICRAKVEERAANCFHGEGLLPFIDKTRVSLYRAIAKRRNDVRLSNVYVGTLFPETTFFSVVKVASGETLAGIVKSKRDWTPDMLAELTEKLSDALESSDEDVF